MLKSLKQADIDGIIAACGPDEPASNTETPVGEGHASAARESVYGIVEHLSREAQEELLALMWTGGPKNDSSFEQNLDLAHKTWDENHAAHIAEQHAKLPNYLRDGLRRAPAQQA